MTFINVKQFLLGLRNIRSISLFYKKPTVPWRLKINLNYNGEVKCCLRTAQIIAKWFSFFSVKTSKLISGTCWGIAKTDTSSWKHLFRTHLFFSLIYMHRQKNQEQCVFFDVVANTLEDLSLDPNC